MNKSILLVCLLFFSKGVVFAEEIHAFVNKYFPNSIVRNSNKFEHMHIDSHEVYCPLVKNEGDPDTSSYMKMEIVNKKTYIQFLKNMKNSKYKAFVNSNKFADTVKAYCEKFDRDIVNSINVFAESDYFIFSDTTIVTLSKIIIDEKELYINFNGVQNIEGKKILFEMIKIIKEKNEKNGLNSSYLKYIKDTKVIYLTMTETSYFLTSNEANSWMLVIEFDKNNLRIILSSQLFLI